MLGAIAGLDVSDNHPDWLAWARSIVGAKAGGATPA